MSASSALSQCLSAVRRWLRHTWLSRLSLWERGRAWFTRTRKTQAARRWQPPQCRPALEVLEERWAPNDPLGTMQAPLLLGGMALSSGGVVSPLSVLANGWPAGVAPASVTPTQAETQSAPAEDAARMPDDEVLAQLAQWRQATLHASGDGLSGHDAAASSDSNQAHDDWLGWVGRTATASRNDLAGDGLDPLMDQKPAAARRSPPLSGNALNPNAHADGGGSGPGGKSTPASAGGNGGGGGGGGNLHLPSMSMLTPFTGGGDAGTAMPVAASGSGAAQTAGQATANAATTDATTANADATASVPTANASTATDAATFSAVAQQYGSAPLAFVPNVGQTDSSVQFLAQGGGLEMFLTDAGATFSVPVANPTAQSDANTPAGANAPAGQRDVFAMQLVGANPHPQIIAQDPLASTSNYFFGDSSQWHADVPNYGSVEYKDIYAGINLVFDSTSTHQLEYHFEVEPGADPSVIRQTWQGVNSTSIDGNGNLVLQTPGGPVVQQAPFVYQQDAGGVRQTVGVSQIVTDASQTAFQVGAYDSSKPLIIDPTLAYSTYLGGSGNEDGYGIAVDGYGNAYVAGTTLSTDFPTQLGLQSQNNSSEGTVFVAKLNAAGNGLIYSTYLGGSDLDNAYGIAVDDAGNAYVTGLTQSSDFPVTPGAAQTTGGGAFVSKLSASGDALLASTFVGQLGGASHAIAVDTLGNVYITGQASGFGSFPITTGAFQTTAGGGGDAFVTKLDPALSTFIYSSYLGGSGDEDGWGIAVDSHGNAYAVGDSTSSDFPTTPGAYRTTAPGTDSVFVTEVNASGSSRVYSTYLGGGSGFFKGVSVAVDNQGAAYVAGTTTASDFPTTSGAFQTSPGTPGVATAFVSKLAPGGTALAYSTYLGGSSGEEAYGVAVDALGNAYVAGTTSSSDFPRTVGAFQSSLNGDSDAFITKLDPTGSTLVYSSYLGGSGSGDVAYGIAVDLFGAAYLTGSTNSTDFPIVDPVQGTNAGGTDAFVTKVLSTPAVPVFTGITPDTGISSSDQLTQSQNIRLLGTSAASAIITMYRRGVGRIGTTIANSSGQWNFDYTGTALPEGVAAFSATATVNGITSAPSSDFLVTIDRTAPVVTASVPATTTSLGPQVRVTASDLNGLPNGTVVTIDMDLDHDGNFTSPGETGYASGTLTDGVALITLPALPALGTYDFLTRVTDPAGNRGTSSLRTFFTVTSVTSTGTLAAQVLSSDPFEGDSQDQLGNMTLSQPLDLDQNPGTDLSGGAALVYNSDSVNVRPIVQATIPTANNQALPATITAQLTWTDPVTMTSTTTTVTYSTAGFSPGDVLTLAVQEPTVLTHSGRYAWSMQVTLNYGTPEVQTTSGIAYVVTQDASPFGSGWTFAPVEQLISIAADSYGPAGMLRVFGTGEWRFYQSTGGLNYQSPVGDNGTLSQHTDGTFWYVTPDGTSTEFNSSGQEIYSALADGTHAMQYRYTGNLLTGLTTMDNSLATFTYSGGLLATIQASNSRTVTLSYSGTNLTQITNPDGGLHTFSYDSSHHLTGETFANLQNEWAYTSAGTVGTYTWGSPTGPGGVSNPSQTVYNPAVVQGLSSLVAGLVQASMTDPDNHTTRWVLDAQGRALQTLDADGGLTVDQYTGGYVTSETDPLGRTTTYTRDSLGYVTQEILPDSSTRTYQYQTALHLLTTYTDERNFTTTYSYDSFGHMLTETDPVGPSGETTSYTYNASNGLVQTVTDPLNHTTTYVYNGYLLMQVIDPLGNTTSYTYDGLGNPQTVTDPRGDVTSMVFDVMGREIKETDPLGNVTTLTYNAADLELTETDANHEVTSLVYDGFHRGLVADTLAAAGSSVQTSELTNYDAAGNDVGDRDADGAWTLDSYDAMNQLTQTTNALGGVTRQVYDLDGEEVASRDELGNWTQMVYNVRGWVTQTIDALNEITTYGYDAAGNQTSVTDPMNHITTTDYDGLDRPTVETDASGQRTTIAYDAAGNTSSVEDPDTHVTSYVYDPDNRLINEYDAVGTLVQRTLTFAYDQVGNQTSFTDAPGHTTTTVFDKDNRAVATEDPLGHTTTAVYDTVGNEIASIDPMNQTTTFVFNLLNEQVGTIDPLGHKTTDVVDGDGQDVGTIDPLGNATRDVFDPLGRQTATVDAKGGVDLTVYDAASNTAEVIDADGNQTNYVYDALDREVSQSDAYGTTGTTYDSVGRVSSVTDADNRTITYSYDNDNRETGETWKSSTGVVVNTLTYTYDNAGNQLTAANNAGTYTFTYDALNRVATQTDPFGLTLTYTYNAEDQVTQRQDSLGGTLTNTYDNANRLTSRQLSAGGQQVRIDPGYDNRDEMTSLTRYADVAGTTVLGTTIYNYDIADPNRLTSIVNENGTGVTLSYYNYSYDNADRVSTESWHSQVGTVVYSGNHTYSYDATNQLTGDGTNTYTYDSNGNRTLPNYQTGADNRLTTDGTWTYTYDSVGNQIQKVDTAAGVTWTYSYDNLNHLVSAVETVGGVTSLVASYTYDVFDNLIQEQHWTAATGTVTLRHAYDGANAWADLDASNNPVARYVYGDDGSVWARLVPTGQPNAGVAFYLTDRLGSVVDWMDSTQVLRNHVDYDPFGKTVTEANASFADAYKYDSGRTDSMTGLIQFGERWYNPATGTWLEQDPLGLGPDSNPYRYVGNDPTNALDPSGLQVKSDKVTGVTINFKPGGKEFKWGDYVDSKGKTRVGNAINVDWKVEGNPKKIKFEQNENGFIQLGLKGKDQINWFTAPVKGKNNVLPVGAQSYTDDFGQAINVNDPLLQNAVLRLNVKTDIEFKATGSDNKAVAVKKHIEGWVDFTIKAGHITIIDTNDKAMPNSPYAEDAKTNFEGKPVPVSPPSPPAPPSTPPPSWLIKASRFVAEAIIKSAGPIIAPP